MDSEVAARRAVEHAESEGLTRLVRELLPTDGEVAGLLALMLLTDHRQRHGFAEVERAG